MRSLYRLLVLVCGGDRTPLKSDDFDSSIAELFMSEVCKESSFAVLVEPMPPGDSSCGRQCEEDPIVESRVVSEISWTIALLSLSLSWALVCGS